MIAKNFISNTPPPVRLSETGTDVLFHMDENRLADMPVVDKNNLLGSVVESDVFLLDDPDAPLSGQKVAYKRHFVFESQHVLDVIKTMASSGLTVLPVLNDKEKYTGCIVQGVFVQMLASILSVDNPGAIIVLEVNQRDYVLSEIAKIVESQDNKILNLFVTTEKDSTKMEVTIKLNTLEIQALIQTFNRYNYIIKAAYTEDEKMYDDLRDRYESLMRYLSI
jgi:acetoin utilization protein AcuB